MNLVHKSSAKMAGEDVNEVSACKIHSLPILITNESGEIHQLN